MPVISKSDPSELIIAEAYGRTHGLLNAILALNNDSLILGIPPLTRTLFEAYIDLVLLIGDSNLKIENAKEKLELDSSIQACISSKRYIEAFSGRENDQIRQARISMCEKYLSENEQTIMDKMKLLYPERKNDEDFPKRWYACKHADKNVKGIEELTRAMGTPYHDMFIETYSFLSRFVHSGSSSYRVGSSDYFMRSFIRCHDHTYHMMIKSVKLICRKFAIKVDFEEAVLDIDRMKEK